MGYNGCMTNPTNEELAYLAGMVDGDGCISIHRIGKPADGYYALTLAVGNTHMGMLEWIRARFGGTITTSGKPCKPHHAKKWTWAIYGQPMADLLSLLYPYLVAKKRQAELGVEYRVTVYTPSQKGGAPGRAKLSEEMKAYRLRIYTELKSLNFRVPAAERLKALEPHLASGYPRA